MIQTCLLGNWYLQEVGPHPPLLSPADALPVALAGVIITNGILWLECLQEVDLCMLLLLLWRTSAGLVPIGRSHFS